MNLGNDPADQVVRYSLEGAEVALKLSGLAAKNFAVFAYALLKDQKRTRGRTNLVRMLKEQRPLKFFTLPKERMKEFAYEAKSRGLLFVPIRSRQNPTDIELAVFADDAAKVSRVLDQLRLDFVPAGEAVAAENFSQRVEPETPAPSGNFWLGREASTGSTSPDRPSVRKELQAIQKDRQPQHTPKVRERLPMGKER